MAAVMKPGSGPLDYGSRTWLKALFAALFFMLYVPIVPLIAFSFNTDKRGIVWRGFTFDNYVKAWNNASLIEAMVNSLVIAPLRAARLAAGRAVVVEGMAWDAGHGIDRVEVSLDGGASWRVARLGDDAGRYSLRPRRFEFTPAARGPLVVLARATNRLGQTQAAAPIANPSGYHHNVAEPIEVQVT